MNLNPIGVLLSVIPCTLFWDPLVIYLTCLNSFIYSFIYINEDSGISISIGYNLLLLLFMLMLRLPQIRAVSVSFSYDTICFWVFLTYLPLALESRFLQGSLVAFNGVQNLVLVSSDFTSEQCARQPTATRGFLDQRPIRCSCAQPLTSTAHRLQSNFPELQFSGLCILKFSCWFYALTLGF